MLTNVQRYGPALSNNTGYTGVVVAVLAGGFGPQLLVMALVFAIISIAGNVLTITGAPSELVFAMYGLILICAAIGQGLRHVRIVNPGRAERTEALPGIAGAPNEGRPRIGLHRDRDHGGDACPDRRHRRAPRRDRRHLQHRDRGGDADRGPRRLHRRPADRRGPPWDPGRHDRRRSRLALFALAVVVFKADVVVGGLALVFLGFGLTGLVGKDYVQEPASATIPHWDVPLLSDIPFWGEAFFEQMSISYFAFLFPVAAMFLLYRTQHGLNMRSIGEDPGAADATGLSVSGWRIFYVAVGGAFAGLGGAVLTLGIVGTWLPNVTAGQGWIALAVVIFASWRPLPLIAGALLFGGLGTFGNVAQVEGWSITPEFFSALPYVGTLLMVYLLAVLRIRRGGGTVAGGAGFALLPWHRLTRRAGTPVRKGGPHHRCGPGPGRGGSRALLPRGARVVLADVRDAEGEDRAEALRAAGHQAIYRHLDVSLSGDWDLAIGTAESEFGPLEVLVNNAGIVSFGGVGDMLAGGVEQGRGGQPDGRLSGYARRYDEHAPRRRRLDRQHLLDLRDQRGARLLRLPGEQGGGGTDDACGCGGAGPRWDSGQLRPARAYLHPDDRDRARGVGHRQHRDDPAGARRRGR